MNAAGPGRDLPSPLWRRLAARVRQAREITAFVLVGGSLTVLGAGLVYILLLSGWRYDAASVIAWAVTVLIGFAAHRIVTFQMKGPATLAEAMRFLGTSVLRLALSTAGLGLLLEGLHCPPGPAVILNTAIMTLVFFVVMRRFVFMQPVAGLPDPATEGPHP